MADYMQAPKRNALLGVLADATRAADDYAQRPDSTMPMGKANALLSVLSRFAGVPAVASTLDRLSYGDSLTTGSGYTTRIRPEVVEAALAAAPVVSYAGKMAGRGANALADASVRAITRNPQATAQNALAYAAQMRPVTPATVWHGSPHKFDRFDASKIGTGEGAQAYGHGLYLADSPDVAKSYMRPAGRTATEIDGKNVINAAYEDRSLERAVRYLQDYKSIDEAAKWATYHGDKSVADQITQLAASGRLKAAPAGEFYKVDLPDEKIARMLDWDKPLSQQPQSVRIALTNIAKQDPEIMKVFRELGPNAPANQAYAAMTQHAVRMKKYAGMRAGMDEAAAMPSLAYGQDSASSLMKQQGIPGIRYLDGGSRGAGGGTSNFVIFPGEENALTILERNGVPLR